MVLPTLPTRSTDPFAPDVSLEVTAGDVGSKTHKPEPRARMGVKTRKRARHLCADLLDPPLADDVDPVPLLDTPVLLRKAPTRVRRKVHSGRVGDETEDGGPYGGGRSETGLRQTKKPGKDKEGFRWE